MKRWKKMTVWACALSALGVGGVGAGAAGINAWMKSAAEGAMYDDAGDVPERDVAIVLGARVMPSGNPSHALADRLAAALDLWKAGKVRVILVTGDHAAPEYNEVATMFEWLTQRGVPRDRIFVDHAGLRTHDSMQRAVRVFEVESAVVCTQRFHLARSIYLARAAGIDAVGLVADRRVYARRRRDARREFAARVKAWLDIVVLDTQPRHLGPVIPITGPASASHDASILARQ